MPQELEGKQLVASKSGKNKINILPNVLLRSIGNFLSIIDFENYVNLCRDFHQATVEDFWRRRFNLYFPHEKDIFRIQGEAMDEHKKDVRKKVEYYRRKFKEVVEVEYKGFTQQEIRWMNFFKRGDLAALQEQRLTLEVLSKLQDGNGRKLAYWANENNHQDVLDYYYEHFRFEHISLDMLKAGEHIFTDLRAATIFFRNQEFIRNLSDERHFYSLRLSLWTQRRLFTGIIYMGNLPLIKCLPNELESCFSEGLLIAAGEGHVEIVKHLLKYAKYHDYLLTSGLQEWAFKEAIINDRLNVARIFYSLFENDHGLIQEMFELAASENKPEIVKYFFSQFSADYIKNNEYKILKTFSMAIYSYNFEVVKLFYDWFRNDERFDDSWDWIYRHAKHAFLRLRYSGVWDPDLFEESDARIKINKYLAIRFTNLIIADPKNGDNDFSEPSLKKMMQQKLEYEASNIIKEAQEALQKEIELDPYHVLRPLADYFENWNRTHGLIFWRRKPECLRYCFAYQLVEAYQAGSNRLSRLVQQLLHDPRTASSFEAGSFRAALNQIKSRLDIQRSAGVIVDAKGPVPLLSI